MYNVVNFGLNSKFSVDNSEVKESFWCKTGFNGGFREGIIKVEVKNAGS